MGGRGVVVKKKPAPPRPIFYSGKGGGYIQGPQDFLHSSGRRFFFVGEPKGRGRDFHDFFGPSRGGLCPKALSRFEPAPKPKGGGRAVCCTQQGGAPKGLGVFSAKSLQQGRVGGQRRKGPFVGFLHSSPKKPAGTKGPSPAPGFEEALLEKKSDLNPAQVGTTEKKNSTQTTGSSPDASPTKKGTWAGFIYRANGQKSLCFTLR